MVRSPYSTGSARGYPKLVAETVAKWKPDLMFAHHGKAAGHLMFLETMHRYGVKTAVYLCDEPYETGRTAGYSPGFKFVFTMDPCTLSTHRKAGSGRSQVFYLPPGVDTDHFKLVDYSNRPVPVRFLGNASLTPRPRWLKPVENLIEGADIRYYPDKNGRTVAKGHHKWVPLERHPQHYSECKLGINVYRNPAIDAGCYKKFVVGRSRSDPIPRGMTLCAQTPKEWGTGFWNDANLPAAHVNPRFLEMSACGTLTISDDSRSEHSRLFPMAPVAEDPEHMMELIYYYLEHEDEAEELGRACSYQISRRHSYRHRAAEVLIRAGFKDADADDLRSCLGEPEDWLSPQDFNERGVRSSSGATGRSERWSPQFGKSSISPSGSPSEATSIDVQTPWLL